MKPAQLAALARNQHRITKWFPTFASIQTGGDLQIPQAAMPPAAMPAPMPSAPMPVAPMPREINPAPAVSYVDLDALTIVSTDDPSLNGAALLSVNPTEDHDLVSATYKDPVTGQVVTEVLPILPADPHSDPWWKREGHCCESCALGHDCEGGACGVEKNPSSSPPRRRGIFARG
jgi:hypothetical protein